MTDSDREVIYVLTNPAMPGFVKIGKTSPGLLKSRLNGLYSTNVSTPFDCEYACEVRADLKVEEALHEAFSDHRPNRSREFFTISPGKIIRVLKLSSLRDVTPEVEREMESSLTEDDRKSSAVLKRPRGENMNFQKMGIPIGAVLSFANDPSVKVEVIDSRRVQYEGVVRSLTAVTRDIMELGYSVRPAPHWMFEGRSLQDIYDETYEQGRLGVVLTMGSSGR